MPRDSGGIGRTGKKHKQAAQRWRAKDKGKNSTGSTAAASPAATTNEEPEEKAGEFREGKAAEADEDADDERD